MSYNSKYTGKQIENLLDSVGNKANKATTLEGYGIKDAVKIATKSANVSESCVGYTTHDHNLRNGGLFTGLGADGLYGSQLLGNYVGTGLYYRGKINGTWTDWKTVAFTDSDITGNATSATKLQTARKIWGQNFNGTADISGRMTGVTSIENTNGLLIVSNELSFAPENAGNLKRALVIGGSIDYGLAIWGHGSGKCYLQVGRTDGLKAAYDLILQHLGGNVGIGTDTPTEKLHVQGNIYSSGSVRIDGARLTYDTGTLTIDKALKTTGNIDAPNITTIQENVNTLMNKVQVGIKNKFVYYNLDEFLRDPTTVETILGDPVIITSSAYFEDTNRLIINSGVFNGVSKYQIECKYNRENSFESDLTIECIESNNSGQIQLKAYHADGSEASMNGAYDVVITIYQNI